ncbi:LPXTG cell wall anchor domain-containing protein [Streptomyces sp. NBC_01239]|uniref:LPXTG cell wall anchor domain-containing protein n=1 Tax=Streptomyces sp. NBC_01239 TaxID=2903792 RepID=UPI00225362F3|nr:LPXTG cell wall anchor domain-containing protein [Streptomyces sp. NBC_01239]MCX4813960.1 LPXTG cell wall anchor domain-containing protein [Streptomyces sp. NBC_01239]
MKTLTDNTDTTGQLLLGANTAADDTGTSTPTPTPTPAPTHTGKPTPAPAHSAGGGGSTPAPAPTPPAPDDPSGDLAHTGNDTPVGLITGIAGALAVAGGVLVWWMRRRRTARG